MEDVKHVEAVIKKVVGCVTCAEDTLTRPHESRRFLIHKRARDRHSSQHH